MPRGYLARCLIIATYTVLLSSGGCWSDQRWLRSGAFAFGAPSAAALALVTGVASGNWKEMIFGVLQ